MFEGVNSPGVKLPRSITIQACAKDLYENPIKELKRFGYLVTCFSWCMVEFKFDSRLLDDQLVLDCVGGVHVLRCLRCAVESGINNIG